MAGHQEQKPQGPRIFSFARILLVDHRWSMQLVYDSWWEGYVSWCSLLVLMVFIQLSSSEERPHMVVGLTTEYGSCRQALKTKPFMPLNDASNKNLTGKAIFYITIASPW